MVHKMTAAAARNSHTIKAIRDVIEDTQATLASLEAHYHEVMQLSRYLNTTSKFNGFLSHRAAADVPLESTKCTVTSLSPEPALVIFKLLDQITSTCLGLTCKAFCRIHKSIRGKAHLQRPSPGDEISNYLLVDLLSTWKPLGVAYCSSINKFVTLEQLEEIYCFRE